MQNEPSLPELLAVVRGLLSDEIVPTISDGGLRFKALIAINLLGIMEREVTIGDDLSERELERLRTMMPGIVTAGAPQKDAIRTLSRALSAAIRAGETDSGEFGEQARQHVRQTLIDQLKVSNPKYLKKFKLE